MFYFAIMALCCVACEDKDETQNMEEIYLPRGMYVSLNSEIVEGFNNHATIAAEEGGEFIIRTELQSRVQLIAEYGDSFNLPIEEEYTCIDFYRDGARCGAYATYISGRLNYGAEYELIDPQYSYSYVLPWSFDQREWYEIVQLEESELQLIVKPCEEYRVLILHMHTFDPQNRTMGSCLIECIPASEMKE